MRVENKVLIVLPNNKLGGAEQILLMVAKSLLNKGFFVEIYFFKYFSNNGWENLKDNNLKYFIGSKRNEKIGFLKFIFRMIISKNRNYSLSFTSHIICTSIVGFLNSLQILTIETLIARESTSVFKRFTGFKKKIYEIFYWIGYRKINLLICQTEDMKDQLEENLPYISKRTRIKVIPNPIDLDAIKLLKEEDNLHLVKESDLIQSIVTAGRLIPEKGFDLLIESFRILLNTYSENLNLYILGEGPERELLQAKINQLSLHDKVFLKGFQTNVYSYFKNADVCVVSSRIEGFPNVLLQMMSQNEKVVSTLCAGGINEIPGITISKETTSVNLAKAIKKCFLTDTASNNIIFSDFLNKRDITQFMKTIFEDVKI